MVLELLQALVARTERLRQQRPPTTVSPELEARYREVEKELREGRQRDRRDVPEERGLEAEASPAD